MRSIGVALGPWVKKGLLHFQALRPTAFGLEMHLTGMHKTIDEFKPAAVVMEMARLRMA